MSFIAGMHFWTERLEQDCKKKLPDFKFWRKHFFELLTSQVYREASISSLVSFEAFHQKDVDRYFERGWTRNMTVVKIWQGKAASEKEITGKSNFIQHLELFLSRELKNNSGFTGKFNLFEKRFTSWDAENFFIFIWNFAIAKQVSSVYL